MASAPTKRGARSKWLTRTSTTKDFKIHVNGVEKIVDHEVLTFTEVVDLAFPSCAPDTIFSVSFSHGREPKEGELLEGGSVTVKNNTEFDVDDTGRS